MRYFSGMDVGRFKDWSTHVRLGDPGFRVCLISRRQNLPMPEQCTWAEKLARQCQLTAIDQNGLGVAVADHLEAAGVPLVRVSIHGGDGTRLEGRPGLWRMGVPKLWLISRLIFALNSRQFSVSVDVAHREELRDELARLRATFTPAGNVRVEAETGHDDLALGCALMLLARDVWGYEQEVLAGRAEGDRMGGDRHEGAEAEEPVGTAVEGGQSLAERLARHSLH